MRSDWFRASWNRAIDFGQNTSLQSHAVDSVWTYTDTGAWSNGAMARLAFRLPKPRYETYLCLHVSPFLGTFGPSCQEAYVTLNGKTLAHGNACIRQSSVLIYRVDQALLQSSGILVLCVVLPNATSPSWFDPQSSTDNRQLGLKIHSVRWADIWYDYQLGQKVLISEALANRHLLFGWSNPESEFVWSNAETALLLIRCEPYDGDLVFRMKAKIFMPQPELPPMTVALSVNDRLTAEVQFENPYTQWAEFSIRSECQRPDGLLQLRFDIKFPRRPCDFGASEDPRPLGFAIFEFCVEPANMLGSFAPSLGADNKSEDVLLSEISWTDEKNPKSMSTRSEVEPKWIYGWGEPLAAGTPCERDIAIVGVSFPQISSRWRLEYSITYSPAKEDVSKIASVSVYIGEIYAGTLALLPRADQRHTLVVWPSMVRSEGATHIRFELNNVTCNNTVAVSGIRYYPAVLNEDLFQCPQDQLLVFAHDRSADGAFTEGWKGIDELGIWSDNSECVLAFTPDKPLLPLSVYFELDWLPAACVGWKQSLVITINGRSAGFIRTSGEHTHVVEVAPSDLMDHDWLELRFICFSAESLEDMGMEDTGDQDEQTSRTATLPEQMSPDVEASFSHRLRLRTMTLASRRQFA